MMTIETQYHITPKVKRIDNGHEFMLTNFYASNYIIHQKSCVKLQNKIIKLK